MHLDEWLVSLRFWWSISVSCIVFSPFKTWNACFVWKPLNPANPFFILSTMCSHLWLPWQKKKADDFGVVIMNSPFKTTMQFHSFFFSFMMVILASFMWLFITETNSTFDKFFFLCKRFACKQQDIKQRYSSLPCYLDFGWGVACAGG